MKLLVEIFYVILILEIILYCLIRCRKLVKVDEVYFRRLWGRRRENKRGMGRKKYWKG